MFGMAWVPKVLLATRAEDGEGTPFVGRGSAPVDHLIHLQCPVKTPGSQECHKRELSWLAPTILKGHTLRLHLVGNGNECHFQHPTKETLSALDKIGTVFGQLPSAFRAIVLCP